MKISLRNFVLAATVVVAAVAYAETPTVTQKWKYTLKTPDVPAQAEARYGAGVNGKIFFRDKANKKIKYVDSKGQVTELCSVKATGPAIAVDDAGNILVNDGWSGIASGSKFVLISADGKTQKTFTYSADGFTNTRTDQLGRAVGDFFSEEGGYIFLAENNNYLLCMKNGELVNNEFTTYTSGATNQPAGGSSTMAQPLYTFEELKAMGAAAVNGYAARIRTGKNIMYDCNPTTKKLNTMTAPPKCSSAEGFDVFSLDNTLYQVMPILEGATKNYTDEFCIADSKGTVIFKEQSFPNAKSSVSTLYQTYNARKVSDYKVELYVYSSGPSSITFAMYEITIPEPEPEYTLPDVYLRGSVTGWEAKDDYKFVPVIADGDQKPEVNANGEYEMKLYVDRLNGEFKLADATANFETFNYGYASGDVKNGSTVELKSGWGTNVNMGTVDLMHVTLTFYYNPDDSKSSWLKIEGEDYDPEYVVLPDVYLRGDITGWDVKDAYKMAPVIREGHRYPTKNNNGEYEYTLTLDRVYGNFKLGGKASDWSDFNYGGDGETHLFAGENSTLKAWPGSSENFEMGDMILDNVTVSFFYNAEASPSWLQIQGTKLENYTDRAHFAYDLKMEFDKVNGIYHFSFKSTGEAPHAYLVATPVADSRANGDGDGVVTIDLGAVTKGDNHHALYDTNFEYMKNYTWAIELHNYEVPYSKAVKQVDAHGQYRGSIIPMVDDQYPSYGYIVVGDQSNHGFEIYDPEGNLVKEGLHKQHSLLGGTGTNQSNPIRGTEHRGHALVASWGDSAYGVTAFDPTDFDSDLYSVFEGEKDSSGLIKNNGVSVGSGTSCVAVYGKGADAVMYTFDEDILNNNIAKYTIGDKRTISIAPFNVGYGSRLTNTNVEICPVKEGIFVTQVRVEGNSRNTNTPGMMFLNNKNIDDASIKTADWYPTHVADANFLTSCNSGVAVNKDETLLAVSSYSKIHIMNLSFADGKPVMTEKETIKLPASTDWSTMRFDAADNLHVYARGNGSNYGYRVYGLANKQPIVKTNAPAESLLLVTTGVENVDVDAADETEAVYYNLSGVRMDGSSLTPGVYVKVVGKTITKIVVK